MGFTIKGSGSVSDTECNVGSAQGSLQKVQIFVGKWHTFARNKKETDEAKRCAFECRPPSTGCARWCVPRLYT